jgi:HemK-like putative methylase
MLSDSLTPHDLYQTIYQWGASCHIPDWHIETKLLIQHYMPNLPLLWWHDHTTYLPIDKGLEQALYSAFLQRQQRIPLAYILGQWPFSGHSFFTDSTTLIPRPETEFLVDWATEKIANLYQSHPQRPVIVWDLFAGTGCVGISIALDCLAKQIPCVVYCFEKYSISLLNKNIQKFAKQNNVSIYAIECDLSIYLQTGFISDVLVPAPHIIVANPPYVSEDQYTHIAPELQWEPKQALVPMLQNHSVDSLYFIKKLWDWLHTSVLQNHTVSLACELGNDQGKTIQTWWQSTPHYTPHSIVPDIHGYPRFWVYAQV